jgi:hypothetical protein
MKMLLLVCLVELACACTPHGVRCSGPLEPVNTSTATPDPAAARAGRLAGRP